MAEPAVDVVAHRVADAQSRRSSLLGLGGAALAAVFTGPAVARAGKAGKKARKKCKKQSGPCQPFVMAICERVFLPGPNQDLCIEETAACCEFLGRCNATAFFDCVLDAISAG
ncbi:MAG: hypothetical protein ACRDJC_02015 [Thermomicrobiales bacterium]